MARYGAQVGEVRVCFSWAEIGAETLTSPAIIFGFFLIIFASAIIGVAPLFRYRRSVVQVIDQLELLAQKGEIVGSDNDVQNVSRDEVGKRLVDLVQSAVKARLEVEAVKSEVKIHKILGELASQVAHDIRSPLAALEMAVQDKTHIPESTRVLIRNAVSRVRDIANNLMAKNRELTALTRNRDSESLLIAKTLSTDTELASKVLLSSLVEPVITEKRMQFRQKIGIEIDARLDTGCYGLFASIQPIEFKRVMSNLINNAVEVLGNHGRVGVSVSGTVNSIEIRVTDNGKGIPPEILAKLGRRGETHDKEGGSGLGLYHARTSIESWGGNLRIASKVGEGTAITLTIPRAPSPNWFVSRLPLVPGTSIVVVDDDSSIHQVWQGRFDSLRVTEKQIEVVHLSTPDQFRDWVKVNETKAHQAVYLVDYELLGFTDTGLSLISELNLGKQSVLVTSRFEERHILEGCQKLEVRLIPKGMAGFVPVEFAVKKQFFDAILIDDDEELVHMSWAMAANTAGKTLKSFSHPDQFFAVADKLEMSSSVYVDANLGAEIKGEVVAEKIFKMGFSNVYLATGYEAANYTQYTFLKGVLGKEPPF